jgi:S-adenosylmethionine:tRNA ribosyltransferase-isomerase
MRKSDFFYELPENLIAQTPPERRGDSRLLCMAADGRLADRRFSELPELLAPGDLLVLNDTRVMPARLFGRKQTGGRVELLIERVLEPGLALAHLRAGKSPKPGATIMLDGGFECRVIERRDGLFVLEFLDGVSVDEVLSAVGRMPLPPYIERPDGEADRERYQTVFARTLGAVAAPTAGLHFDEVMLDGLKDRGIEHAFVTLHVGSGTFLPLRVEHLDEHRMHAEVCEVPEATVRRIEATRERGARVIAVGTTVVRSLETAARSGRIAPYQGETRLFIKPGFIFSCVDALLTNFHLPESTLLTLVCAFAGYREVMAAYRHAVSQQYRFFSYGDAMWLERRRGFSPP